MNLLPVCTVTASTSHSIMRIITRITVVFLKENCLLLIYQVWGVISEVNVVQNIFANYCILIF